MDFLGAKIPDGWSIEPLGGCLARGVYEDGNGRAESILYDLFKGVMLESIDLSIPTLPAAPAHNAPTVCINYCTSGRCECDMGQAGSMVVGEGSLCISSAKAHGFTYPTGRYTGFEYWLGLGCGLEQCDEVLASFGIDLVGLGTIWCSSAPASLAQPEGETLYLCKAIDALLREEEPDIGELRLATCELLRDLARIKPRPHSGAAGYIQKSQRDMARILHDSIVANPSQAPDIAALAKGFGVSSSSLRTYFERVYGVSPTAFARSLVMDKACSRLEEQTDSISEIALVAGYSNPSKFSAAFKREMGITPLEYRRRSALAAKTQAESSSLERNTP